MLYEHARIDIRAVRLSTVFWTNLSQWEKDLRKSCFHLRIGDEAASVDLLVVRKTSGPGELLLQRGVWSLIENHKELLEGSRLMADTFDMRKILASESMDGGTCTGDVKIILALCVLFPNLAHPFPLGLLHHHITTSQD